MLFATIKNLPNWAQRLTYLNPVRCFIEVVRLILLKGAGWAEIQPQTLIDRGGLRGGHQWAGGVELSEAGVGIS